MFIGKNGLKQHYNGMVESNRYVTSQQHYNGIVQSPTVMLQVEK